MRQIVGKTSTPILLILATMVTGPWSMHGEKPKSGAAVPWYVSAAAIHRVTLKPPTKYWRFEQLSMDPATANHQLAAWKNEGIDALEIFAPEEGGNSYDGLDAKDRFLLDARTGQYPGFSPPGAAGTSCWLFRRHLPESWI